jgi:Adenylate and Guanylate cyclase catalytic domain
MAAAMAGQAVNVTWPFHTQGNFETFGQSFLQGSSATLVSWSPLVRGEADRSAWGRYSAANDAWVEQGLEWQVQNQGLEMPSGPFEVPDAIYTKDSSDRQSTATGNGPFAPVWQMAGAPISPSVVNFDLLSDDIVGTTMNGVINQGTQAFSKVIYDSSFYYGASALTTDKDGNPIPMPQGFLVTPLHSRPSTDDVVGLVVAVLSWSSFFEKGLTTGTPKVFVVIDNGGCGDTFTLAVTGQEVTFVGEGDTHDGAYTTMGLSTTIAMDETSYMDCGYTISVYPSDAFVETYEDNKPALWSLFVVGIMVFVAVVFFGYDLYVQKRHVKSVNSAAKLNAIVASLFPEEVRDRLFNLHGDVKDSRERSEPPRKSRLANYLSTASEDENEHYDSGDITAPKGKHQEEAVPNVEVGVDMYQTKPIADLFPNTTIMFADIAGFTAWSSVREPSQVFTLLETVYQSFDVIAKRRKVFKVETVGDCYVAVVGLPEPRADHAVVMAKFARECLDRFNELTKKLEITLGPDTADLALRTGLHSG